MRWSSPATRWSTLGALGLAVAAVLAPSAVPIYDGIGNPDEPYRYVNPPAGYRDTKPPTTATGTLKVSRGQSGSAQINSAEYGPQVALYVPVGAFTAAPDDASVSVTAAPVAPPDTLPKDGTIEGNVYRVTAVASDGAVDLIGFANQAPVLDLRAPTARQPAPVFEHFEDGKWTSYQTSRIGNDIYRTRMDALGDWALVRRDSGNGSRGMLLPIVAGLLGACGVSVGVVAIRRRRLNR